MTKNFYANLPYFSSFADFTNIQHYRPLPEDWLVAITDIVSSSKAIENGMYQVVNAVSAASITAILNAAAPLSVPYVFGGDGATICVPSSLYHEVASALVAASQLARESFDLALRVGIVPVQTIQKKGYQILVGKYQPSKNFQQAVFQGGGLKYAEMLLKEDIAENPYFLDETKVEANASFEGFECRWDEIPSAQEETVALMVQSTSEKEPEANQTYANVLETIFDIYGKEADRHPLLEENLSLVLSPIKLAPETMIRTAFQGIGKKMLYLIKAWFSTLLGKFLMERKIKNHLGDWGRYKAQLVENTDYQKFDDTLRMVLSGTQAQRKRLSDFLEKSHQAGKLVYGIHPSESAIMTCVVFNYDTEHIHFLDGANGGYAIAAKAMKKQLERYQ